MGELSKLPNLGKVIEAQLHEAGITTAEELRQVGSRDAWLRIQQRDPSACIHRLMALEGAICGVRKTDLPNDVKSGLKSFYMQHRLKK